MLIMNDKVEDSATSKAIEMLWESLVDLGHPESVAELLQVCSDQNREWGSSASLKAKNSLKAALLENQKGQCAYCRRRIKNELGHVEIDHILPKSAKGDIARSASNNEVDRFCTQGYPQFTFEGKNLILTCKRCNNKKGSYDSRRNRSTAADLNYSLNSNNYLWVHPYIDKYSEHISIHEGLLYKNPSKSKKGDALMRICKLDEIAATEVLARDLSSKSSANYIKAILLLLGKVDEIGWELLIESVIRAFPQVDPSIIVKKVEEFKIASED